MWRRQEENPAVLNLRETEKKRNICVEGFAAEMMMYFWVSKKSMACAAWLRYALGKRTGVSVMFTYIALVLLVSGQL